MRCEEAKEIKESHPGTLSPPISLSWVLEGTPWVRKLLGSPPLCLSNPTPSSVPASNLGSRAELTQYKESHTTTNIKVFPGEKHQHCLVGFPSRQTLQEPFLSFFPPSGSYPWNWPLAIFFFCLWFNGDSFLCHFTQFSLPFILLVWSLSILSYNFLRFRFFSTRGCIGYKTAQLSHNAWDIALQMTLRALWKYDSLWQLTESWTRPQCLPAFILLALGTVNRGR